MTLLTNGQQNTVLDIICLGSAVLELIVRRLQAAEDNPTVGANLTKYA